MDDSPLSPGRRKVRLLIFRDSISFAMVIGLFFLPIEIWVVLCGVGILLIKRYLEKPIREIESRLEPPEKRVYFTFNLLYVLTLLVLILSWILRHLSPGAWAIGGTGIIVLLAVLYAAYDSVFGPNAKL